MPCPKKFLKVHEWYSAVYLLRHAYYSIIVDATWWWRAAIIQSIDANNMPAHVR
jgi:hypothetical protein